MDFKVNSDCEELLKAIANEDKASVIASLQDKRSSNCRNEAGVTGLMIAADRGYDEIIKILLESGADVNAKDHSGITALMTAACSGKESCVKTLLEAGADVQILANDDSSALMYGVLSGKPGVVKMLLDAGANTNVINKSDATVLKLTEGNRYRTIRQMVTRTPDSDYTEIVKLLKEKSE